MTHTEAAFYMSMMQNISKANLLENGYAYPLIIALKKGEDSPPEFEHEFLIDTARHVFKDTKIIKDEFMYDKSELVYCYISMYRVTKPTDEDQLLPISKKIVKQTDPDVIGLISCCVYKQYQDEDDPNATREQILRDPECTRILHSTYYLKGDRTRRDYTMTYINRGKISSAIEIPEWESSEDTNVVYDILGAHSGWFVPNSHDICKLKNPFTKK